MQRKVPMVKMSFSGSDSEQYLNVEPPGIVGLEATGAALSGSWCWNGMHVTMELVMLVSMRRKGRYNIVRLMAAILTRR